MLLAEDLIYKPSGIILENLKVYDESEDYGAAEFTINNQSVKFRVGKIIPTKVGQFVIFWKRLGKGPILPYDFNDTFDFLVVSVRAENHFGQFIFPKAVLCEKGILSSSKKEGKRAMRIYLLGIKQIILKLIKHKLGSSNILFGSRKVILILHA